MGFLRERVGDLSLVQKHVMAPEGRLKTAVRWFLERFCVGVVKIERLF